MKRFLFFAIFIIISFNTFSQHLLDSIFTSIKYPEVPENKSIVYFLRDKINMYGAMSNFDPIHIGIIIENDTIPIALLAIKEYNYIVLDSGEYSFYVYGCKKRISINLKSKENCYIKVLWSGNFSKYKILETENGYDRISDLKLSCSPPWVIVFYEVDKNISKEHYIKENEEIFFNNYLENSKYLTGKLVGVSKESYYLDKCEKIIEIDNLVCKSIFFLKDLPYYIRNNYYNYDHILFSKISGEGIRDGLLFRGNKFLDHIYFFQTFFNDTERLQYGENLIRIYSPKDYYKIQNIMLN